MASGLGNLVDIIGTKLNLPELGMSEFLNGGNATINTARAYNNPIKPKLVDTTNSIGQAYLNAIGAPVSASRESSASGDGGVGGGAAPLTQAQAQAAAQARTQAEADRLLQALGNFDTVQRNQDAQAQGDFDKAMAGFNEQDARDLGRYNEQVGQNEANLSRQRQQALLASAQGSRGLNAVLASLGALGGTGSVLANRAVAQSANRDLGDAQDTFSTNATNLTQSWQDAEQRQRQRKEDAQAQLQALIQNNANVALTGKQNTLRDVANLFDQGSAQRVNYLGQAADLGSQIAATTAPVNARFAKADATFSPEALKNYLAGASDMTVNASAGGSGSNVPINSPLFASTDRRRERQLA